MIDLSAYELVLVLDTQVALEAKPLDKLPWEQLHAAGPILLLCTPTMLSEVDSKKRDGRLGEKARYFNRLVDACVGARQPIVLRDETPRVDLALVAHAPIDWASLGDLDKDQGDDRIVAEALFADVSARDRLTLFSYDMRPRASAARHGMSVRKPPEAWIYEPEPGPAHKEATRLKQRLRELEATQPDIRCDLQMQGDLPVRLVSVRPLPEDALEQLRADILSKGGRQGPSGWHIPDPSYQDRYDKFEKKAEKYGEQLPKALERLFNQIAFSLHFSVEGSVGANHLDVQLNATGARLHDKLVLSKVLKPKPPRYEPGYDVFRYTGPTIQDMLVKVARNEVAFDPKPNRQSNIRLACEDFRQGRSYERRLYAELDPNASSPSEVRLLITAANLKGSVEQTLRVPFEVEEVAVTDLIDLQANTLLRNYRLQTLCVELIDTKQTAELEP